jgi:hypothetical protein
MGCWDCLGVVERFRRWWLSGTEEEVGGEVGGLLLKEIEGSSVGINAERVNHL